MTHKHSREETEKEELNFWASPGAEFGEQMKQLTYMKYLGLEFIHDGNSPYVIDKTGKSILDIGGGPVSLLLKTIASSRAVVDPTSYPDWVSRRYIANNIWLLQIPAENYCGEIELVDEVWMYNVLQHTEKPQKIFDNIYNALKPGGVFRFVDWIDTPTNVAHPISLSWEDVHGFIRGAGFQFPSGLLEISNINENGAVGKIAYGIFKK